MYNLEKAFKYSTKENLDLQVATENVGMSIIGNTKEESELEIKIESQNEVNLDEILDVKFSQRKNKLKIQINEPENDRNKIEIRLSVPQKTNAKINSENGGFAISDIFGTITTSFENSKLTIDNVSGRLNCQSENGSVEIVDSSGPMILETENGAIRLKGCEGKIKIKGENGGVKCSKCSGTIEAQTENGAIKIIGSEFENSNIKTDNGSIYFEFDQTEAGQFTFQNENGKIHLAIPETIPYSIIAKNEIGNFHIGLKGDYNRRKEDGKQLIEMTKASGKVKILAENENGKIVLVNSKLQDTSPNGSFNFAGFADSFEHIIDKIPSKEKQEKYKKKVKKAMKKLKKIKVRIPEVRNVIEDAANRIENDLDLDIDDGNWGKKIKVEIKKSLKATKEEAKKYQEEKAKLKTEEAKVQNEAEKMKQAKTELSEEENEEIKRRSRLKILQMVEQGQINSEEAEKLLNAMEEHNE